MLVLGGHVPAATGSQTALASSISRVQSGRLVFARLTGRAPEETFSVQGAGVADGDCQAQRRNGRHRRPTRRWHVLLVGRNRRPAKDFENLTGTLDRDLRHPQHGPPAPYGTGCSLDRRADEDERGIRSIGMADAESLGSFAKLRVLCVPLLVPSPSPARPAQLDRSIARNSGGLHRLAAR
jgi:hypothetical protein